MSGKFLTKAALDEARAIFKDAYDKPDQEDNRLWWNRLCSRGVLEYLQQPQVSYGKQRRKRLRYS